MELYYKDLISKEASLEKLVDDLVLLVQGANEFAEAAGAALTSPPEELTTKLQRLKEGCLRLRQGAVSSAQATDRVLRRHPYSSVGFAFALGLLAGLLYKRSR